jgi:hypothetical protein
MKFIFNINGETIEKEYDLVTTILSIKKELLNDFYNNECKYLDFELVLKNPIKHFGKLSLEPGLMPSSMDKFKLNKFSINGLEQLNINVSKNNNNNILQNIENATTNIYDKINKRINNEVNINDKESQEFVYKEEDFPSLGS